MTQCEIVDTGFCVCVYFTRTEQHSSLHSLQCIPVTVLSRVSPTSQLIHSTVQQRPLKAHTLDKIS